MANPAATRHGNQRRPGERARTAYLYLLPAFVIYALFVLLPVVQTVRYSFYDWDGFSAPKWSGLANYAALLDDKLFRMAIGHNLTLIVFFTIFPIVIALVLTA